jgi:hypothetical protein
MAIVPFYNKRIFVKTDAATHNSSEAKYLHAKESLVFQHSPCVTFGALHSTRTIQDFQSLVSYADSLDHTSLDFHPEHKSQNTCDNNAHDCFQKM